MDLLPTSVRYDGRTTIINNYYNNQQLLLKKKKQQKNIVAIVGTMLGQIYYCTSSVVMYCSPLMARESVSNRISYNISVQIVI